MASIRGAILCNAIQGWRDISQGMRYRNKVRMQILRRDLLFRCKALLVSQLVENGQFANMFLLLKLT